MQRTKFTAVDVVHMGFIKTGTTYLHNEILANTDGISLLGKPFIVSDDFREFMLDFITASDYSFQAHIFQQRLNDLYKKHFQPKQIKTPVLISHDLWSGDVFTGLNSKTIIDRISSTFGNVKIIITLREQRSIIESWYKHYIAGGGTLHIRDFLYRRVSPSVGPLRTQHMFNKFRYDQIVSHLFDSFGRNNVRVLFYEDLRISREKFYADFFDFVGVNGPKADYFSRKEQNVSLAPASLKLLRILNQIVATPYSDSFILRPFEYLYFDFIHKIIRPLNKLVYSTNFSDWKFIDQPKQWRWEEAYLRRQNEYRQAEKQLTISQDIADRYRDSNSVLERLLNTKLSEKGYAV